MKLSAHENVAAACGGDACALQALLLGVGDNFKHRGLATLLHVVKQRFHAVKRQGMLLESPVFGFRELALLKNLLSVFYCVVVPGEHYNELRTMLLGFQVN